MAKTKTSTTRAPTAKRTKTAKAAPAKAPKAKAKANAETGPPKKMSAIDAAAKALADSKEPMNAKEMIAVMSAKALWTSPGGATPHATLYSAIIQR